jgi:hypothetical protein
VFSAVVNLHAAFVIRKLYFELGFFVDMFMSIDRVFSQDELLYLHFQRAATEQLKAQFRKARNEL